MKQKAESCVVFLHDRPLVSKASADVSNPVCCFRCVVCYFNPVAAWFGVIYRILNIKGLDSKRIVRNERGWSIMLGGKRGTSELNPWFSNT